MHHDLFGSIHFNTDRGVWEGYSSLPTFIRYAVRPPQIEKERTAEVEQKMMEDMQSALDNIKDRMREKFGPGMDAIFDAMNQELAKDPSEFIDEFDEEENRGVLDFTPEENIVAERNEEKRKKDDYHRREGLFPFSIPDREEEGILPEQEKAFAYLVENEAKVCQQVTQTLYESFQQYYADEHWREICSLPEISSPEGLIACSTIENVQITRQHQDGISYLIFGVDADWEQEHGVYLIYHPTQRTEWTTADGLYERFDRQEEEEPPLTQSAELFAALLARDETKVQELLAQGYNINEVDDEDGYPPLCYAVENFDIDLLKRLLALGADPNLKDFEGKTPLKHAKRLLKSFKPKKENKFLTAMMEMARQSNPDQFQDYGAKCEEMICLLEAAGAK